jgi:hypothetical protein
MSKTEFARLAKLAATTDSPAIYDAFRTERDRLIAKARAAGRLAAPVAAPVAEASDVAAAEDDNPGGDGDDRDDTIGQDDVSEDYPGQYITGPDVEPLDVVDAAPAVVVEAPAAPVATARTIGANVARYLRAHGRHPYKRDATCEWMVAHARAAWTAALDETDSRS